jgi:hypothetical protein
VPAAIVSAVNDAVQGMGVEFAICRYVPQHPRRHRNRPPWRNGMKVFALNPLRYKALRVGS